MEGLHAHAPCARRGLGVSQLRSAATDSSSPLRSRLLSTSSTVPGGRFQESAMRCARGICAAIKAGVDKVSFVDGRVPHAVLLEIFTDEGVGTEIVL